MYALPKFAILYSAQGTMALRTLTRLNGQLDAYMLDAGAEWHSRHGMWQVKQREHKWLPGENTHASAGMNWESTGGRSGLSPGDKAELGMFNLIWALREETIGRKDYGWSLAYSGVGGVDYREETMSTLGTKRYLQEQVSGRRGLIFTSPHGEFFRSVLLGLNPIPALEVLVLDKSIKRIEKEWKRSRPYLIFHLRACLSLLALDYGMCNVYETEKQLEGLSDHPAHFDKKTRTTLKAIGLYSTERTKRASIHGEK